MVSTSTLTTYDSNNPSTKVVKWLPSINWDNSVLCEYSYDNWTTTNTLNCASHGSDLPRPTVGAHHIYIRGTNSYGSLTEKDFTYYYDNTVPVWTSCGSDLLDEVSRPYYYLTGDTSNNCTATVNTELHGASTTQAMFTVNGNVDGTGHTITLKGIKVTGIVSSVGSGSGASGGTVNIYNSVVATTTVSGTTGTNGGNGGTLFIASSTTGLLTALGANGTSHGGNGGTITIGTSTTARILTDGGDGATLGGTGGSIYAWNSDGALINTLVSANGGSATGCGDGGNAGHVTLIDYTNYSPTSTAGAGNNNACPTSGHQGGTSNPPVVAPRPSTNNSSSGSGAITQTGGVSPDFVAQQAATPYNPLAQSITLPVQQIAPLKLATLPTFGGTAPGSFSFIDPITNFLFEPLPQVLTATSSLKTFLDSKNITTLQDLATLKVKPLLLPTPAPDSLFNVTTSNLSISNPFTKTTTPSTSNLKTTLTSDSKYNLLQLVSVLPSTTLNVSFSPENKGTYTATFNGQSITFTNNKATLVTPKKLGRYYLITSNSSVPLAIDVKSSKTLSTPVATTTAPVNPVIDVVNKVTDWVSGWFR